jgi:dipeptidyl aminopeptidase/acylaminoacyl peptidase
MSAMRHHLSSIRRLLGSLPILALIVGCAETPPSVTSLLSGEQIILATALPSAPDTPGLYVVDPASGTLSVWRLQGGRGLTEGGSATTTPNDQQRWDADRRELIYSGSFGSAPGLYRIAADGAVTQEPLAALPAGVSWPNLPISAPSRDAVAVIGSVYKPSGMGGEQRVYVAERGDAWATYGEGMGFESIDFLRWAPDGQSLAFLGGTRTGGTYQRRVYLLDLGSGAVRAFSQAEALANSAPAFTSTGAVVFAAAGAAGVTPAIYLAEPGAEATPIIDLGALSGPLIWGDGLALSPDGRLVAFGGARDNPVTPATIYVADLTTGEVRDLLPVDQPIAQTGAAGARPDIALLAWSPDSRRILAVANFDSDCKVMPVSGAVSCNRMLYTLSAEGGRASRLSDTQIVGVRFALWVK